MFTFIKNKGLQLSAATTIGLMAATTDAAAQDNFAKMSENVISSMGNAPGLVSTVAYIAGIGLGVLGILKVKDHVENPSQNPLKDGAVRLGAGGALLALPFLYDVLIGNINAGDAGDGAGVTGMQGIDLDSTIDD